MTPKLRDTNGVLLYMESVSQHDLGVYICVAENSIKNSTRRTTARMEIGKFFFCHKKKRPRIKQHCRKYLVSTVKGLPIPVFSSRSDTNTMFTDISRFFSISISIPHNV